MKYSDKTEQLVVFTERHSDVAASASNPRPRLHPRRSRKARVLCNVRCVNKVLALKQPVSHAPGMWHSHFLAKSFYQFDRSPVDGGTVQPFPIPSGQHTIARPAKSERLT